MHSQPPALGHCLSFGTMVTISELYLITHIFFFLLLLFQRLSVQGLSLFIQTITFFYQVHQTQSTHTEIGVKQTQAREGSLSLHTARGCGFKEWPIFKTLTHEMIYWVATKASDKCSRSSQAEGLTSWEKKVSQGFTIESRKTYEEEIIVKDEK